LDNYTALVDALIKAELDGSRQHERVLQLGATPPQLIDRAGFTDLPLVVTGKVIGKACFDHGIRGSVLKRLPQILAEPKGVFRSASPAHGDSVVVLTFETHGEAPIIVPVRHKPADRARAMLQRCHERLRQKRPRSARQVVRGGFAVMAGATGRRDLIPGPSGPIIDIRRSLTPGKQSRNVIPSYP